MAETVRSRAPGTGRERTLGPGAFLASGRNALLRSGPGTLGLRVTAILPLMVVLLGLALRVLRLEYQPLWWDEGYSVWFATHSLRQMAALTAEDIHPPLYYALLHGWTLLFGARPVALRLFSVIAGAAALPVLYLAGRRILGRRTGLLAALLLAINPLHVYYSQEVRMYGLVALLGAACLWAAWSLFDVPADAPLSRSRLGAYVLLVTAAVYTQYYAVFLPIGLTVYAAWRWRHAGRALLRWLAAQVIVALLYLPWLVYATPKLAAYVSQKVVKDADRPLGPLPYAGRHLSAFLAGHLEGPLAPYWPVVLLLLVPLAAGLWLRGRQRAAAPSQTGRGYPPLAAAARTLPGAPDPVLMLAIVLGTILALGYAINLRAPFFPERGERLLLVGLPPTLLLATAGLDGLWASAARGRGEAAPGRATGARAAVVSGTALYGLVAAASLLAFYRVARYAGDDYRPLVARTVEQGTPGDTVLCIYPWQAGYWASYGSPHGPHALLAPLPSWGPALAGALDAALERGHVWFPAHLALGAGTETQVESYLSGRARRFANEWYGPATRLSGWAGNDPGNASRRASPLGFTWPGPTGGQVTLAEAAGNAGPAPASNAVVPLALTWRAERRPAALAVSVRLVDDLRQIWAQNDYEPLGSLAQQDAGASAQATHGAGSAAWQAQDVLGLLVPAGTPPGRYRVEVALRVPGSQDALQVTAPDGRQLGRAATLFALEVTPAAQVLGPERLPIAQGRPIDLGDGLRFLGYGAGEGPLAPGEERKITLFWQSTGRPVEGYTAFVQLLAQPLGSNWQAPPGAAYDTTRWTPGTLIRTPASVRPRADLPDGVYPLIAGLYRTADGARLRTARGLDHVELGSITIRGRSHDYTPARPAHALATAFGAQAQLAGYDLPSPQTGYRPGVPFSLTLYWRAGQATGRPYSVFVHVLDAAGRIQGAGDGEPGNGRYPTTGWLRGEYLRDEHLVTIAADAPPGDYVLAVGLYDPVSGERLLTPDGRDQVVLESPLRVGPP